MKSISRPAFFNHPSLAAMPTLLEPGGNRIVIGHEITHGFDDVGSKYDARGNVREWYTPEDRKAFEQRTSCEVKEYDNFEPVPGQKLNGSLTLGENTADNGLYVLATSPCWTCSSGTGDLFKLSTATRPRSSTS